MTTYTVTYCDAKGGSEVSTFVEAAGVERDPHWVTFYAETTDTEQNVDGTFCPNCTPLGGMRKARNVTRRQTVALFPTPRIRSVVVSEKAAR